VAVDRVVRDRHHWYDVAAGAGIGFVATELTYFVSDRLIKNDRLALSFAGNRLDVAWQLYK
jgi:membrane-associated phospholipid phosphatase